MNLIFIDFDGVLNTTNNLVENHSVFERRLNINQENLNNLKDLTEQTNSCLIVSSTWRKDQIFIEDANDEDEIIQKFLKVFKIYGWDNAPIMGITPSLSGFRGEEVATYLDTVYAKSLNYIILDDDSDFILSCISELPLSKLDRLGIRSVEEAMNKSIYWSNQNLYKINPEKGLTKEDVEKIINKINIDLCSPQSRGFLL